MHSSSVHPRPIFLGVYEPQRILGEGGMGKVYLARNRKTGAAVVVKVMHDHLASDANSRSLFVQEARMMQKLKHPGVVAIFDASIEPAEARPCIVMEYVAGETLDAIIERDGAWDVESVSTLLGQLCPILYAAHTAGVLHRDLTLGNIMVTDVGKPSQKVKVMDFGLAQVEGPYISLARLAGASSSAGGGTPDYVSPEQIRGEELDPRADIYSLGVILYRLLTGRFPYEEESDVEGILKAHLTRPAPRFKERAVEHVPPAVEAIVFSCLSKTPRERPATAKDLVLAWEKATKARCSTDEDWENAESIEVPTPWDPRRVVDELEAWMPEQIAVMKLRGFVEGVGGVVVESQPGLIHVKMPLPDSTPTKSKSLWSLFGKEPENVANLPGIELLLHMKKKSQGNRSTVQIVVERKPERKESIKLIGELDQHCKRMCRELRAYLMTG